jgi:hypothetical protein
MPITNYLDVLLNLDFQAGADPVADPAYGVAERNYIAQTIFDIYNKSAQIRSSFDAIVAANKKLIVQHASGTMKGFVDFGPNPLPPSAPFPEHVGALGGLKVAIDINYAATRYFISDTGNLVS